jgi:uncharacterized surface protein with fasciclin (FAS1) repeats
MMKNRIQTLFIVAVLCNFLFACNSGEQKTEASASNDNTNVAANAGGGQSTVKDDVSQKNIVQVAAGSADHTTLVAAVNAADLVNALSNAGPFTVFAPTNAAFDKLPKGTVEDLLKPERKEALQNILQYHVSVAVFKPESFYDGQVIGQVNGDNVKIGVKNGKVTVNGANIIASILTSNGIIHVIDAVLLPPAPVASK